MPTRLQVVLQSPFETWVAREIDSDPFKDPEAVASEITVTQTQLIKILTREAVTTAILNVRVAPASKEVLVQIPKGTQVTIDLDTEPRLYGLTVYNWAIVAACLKYPKAKYGFLAVEFVV